MFALLHLPMCIEVLWYLPVWKAVVASQISQLSNIYLYIVHISEGLAQSRTEKSQNMELD